MLIDSASRACRRERSRCGTDYWRMVVGGRRQVELDVDPGNAVFGCLVNSEIHSRHPLILLTRRPAIQPSHTRQNMEAPTKPTTSSLFEVYLRLRPSFAPSAERFLDVDTADDKAAPTHITIHPPAHDQRRKAVETFKFTRCLLYTSPSPRDGLLSRMPSSA